ncbi:PEP-CTERM sorting domain-containing protein [Roseofilum casamattae]
MPEPSAVSALALLGAGIFKMKKKAQK